jgi:hypothetical protein
MHIEHPISTTALTRGLRCTLHGFAALEGLTIVKHYSLVILLSVQ